MTEAEAIAAAYRVDASSDAPSELAPKAELVGPEFFPKPVRKNHPGKHWIVGIKGSDSYYRVNDATGEVSFVLIMGQY